MFFVEKSELEKRLKLIRKELSVRGISEELRGWSYDQPPVEPVAKEIFFGVGDLASRYCPTLRDVYLKKVLRVRPPPTLKMVRGIAYHHVSRKSLLNVKKFIYECDVSKLSGAGMLESLLAGSDALAFEAVREAESATAELSQRDSDALKSECYHFYRFLLVQAASKVDQAVSRFPHADADTVVSVAVPPVAERKVSGVLVGLSRQLSVDIYTPRNAVADLKTGEIRAFHPYTAAGYALAIESDEEIPIDYGFVVYVRVTEDRRIPSITLRTFVVSDELRREFLEIRDEAVEIVEHGRDPGRPARCPDYCPYYPVCR